MAGTTLKKRSFSDGPKAKPIRPSKKQKQRQLAAYHSSSSEGDSDSEDDNHGAPTANLLDDSDDEDLDNMIVDDGASSADEADAHSSSDSDADRKRPTKTPKQTKPPATKPTAKPFVAKDALASDSSAEEGEDLPSDDEEEHDSYSDASDDPLDAAKRPPKRNDSEAMATSMQKILASKMSSARRADPIVARSAEAAAAARAAVDTALETKARKRLREKKRLAMEKGRVRDVLVASTTRTLNVATGEVEETVDDGAETTGQILATERRLRKVAQRGVVKLFNAVRAAQVKAAEAEKVVKKDGLVGAKRKDEKITEMSKKGFLDLIASGGGGLKKGGLEEA